MTRYRLVSDDDGHHFVIPEDRNEEWNRYVESVYESDAPQPEWAHEVGGAPNQVTFEKPEIFGRPVK